MVHRARMGPGENAWFEPGPATLGETGAARSAFRPRTVTNPYRRPSMQSHRVGSPSIAHRDFDEAGGPHERHRFPWRDVGVRAVERYLPLADADRACVH